ncbi:MAG: hypothetical protein JNG89_14105 [Planctomycetaceae bacterium]|nr:hypothetical protein [Planctomycetaceae bacterium]
MTRWIHSAAIVCSITFSAPVFAQRLEVPRAQDKPPGPPLSPAEAVARMVVPAGFSVEVVASEPQIANPVAMFIDEKGRYWITESFEYPRLDAGPGRDTVKVLEDTDGDGACDKVNVFAEGLNIPSGVAVGYGGVWVANSPDILFMQDTDGDLKADKTEVVVTGFGRTDTHELPNSLTWGPDGWLYGLNGVFNHSDVRYAETNPNYKADHPGWQFTCALWRIHPRTREFQVFCEGTSNPWGVAINEEGEFFVSACVIDHLWHLVESGYYVRQGGPYPPHTWPIESIVEHTHQKAAYCGITWFDSDAYPEEYRKVLYMGNIHGGCINADVLTRNGSTYNGAAHPGFPAPEGAFEGVDREAVRKLGDGPDARLADFLTANDAWFMPVVQKTGPDGCLYILDWYDRYHCYQDAHADPEGIERAKGRLYRVRYKDTPHAQPFDLAQKSDDQLIALLAHPNVYMRETAQRLLGENNDPITAGKLQKIALDGQRADELQRRALFAWAGFSSSARPALALATQPADQLDAAIRPFAVRLMFSDPEFRSHVTQSILSQPDAAEHIDGWLANSDTADDAVTHLQYVIGAAKLDDSQVLRVLVHRLAHCGDDPLIPQVVWENLHPLIADHGPELLAILKEYDLKQYPNVAELLPRVTQRLLDKKP